MGMEEINGGGGGVKMTTLFDGSKRRIRSSAKGHRLHRNRSLCT